MENQNTSVVQKELINFFMRPIGKNTPIESGKKSIEQLKPMLNDSVYRIVNGLHELGTFSISFEDEKTCYQFWKI